jgi:hypothetical protein
MAVPGYTAGSALHRTGRWYISAPARATMPAALVVAQQDPCAISAGGGGSGGGPPPPRLCCPPGHRCCGECVNLPTGGQVCRGGPCVAPPAVCP